MPTFKGASSLGHLNRQSKARKLAQPEFCRARFGETENRTFSGITRKKGCRKKGRRRNGEKETVGSEIDEWLFFLASGVVSPASVETKANSATRRSTADDVTQGSTLSPMTSPVASQFPQMGFHHP